MGPCHKNKERNGKGRKEGREGGKEVRFAVLLLQLCVF
jgi:hypothetical protein